MSVLSKLRVAGAQLTLDAKKLFRDLVTVNTVAAAGSTYADATGLTAGKNVVTASNAAKGVMLPVAELDMEVLVVNTVAASALLVYPNTGDQINALTVTTQAFSQAAGSTATYLCDSAGHWYVSANSLTGTATSATQTELNTLAGAGTGGTVVASKAQIGDANQNLGAVKATSLALGTSGSETAVTATGTQLNTAALAASATRAVTTTASITAADHGCQVLLNSTTGFVTTLPAPIAGFQCEVINKLANTTGNHTVVTATSANIIKGMQFSAAGDAGDTGTADDTISFVANSSVAGDRVVLRSDGTSWFAYAFSTLAASVTFTQAS